jgi:hypothetical protein
MRRAGLITETSKEQPSVREGKFQIGESGRLIQEDFCIFSHEAHIQDSIDNQRLRFSLFIFYSFFTIRSIAGKPFSAPSSAKTDTQ